MPRKPRDTEAYRREKRRLLEGSIDSQKRAAFRAAALKMPRPKPHPTLTGRVFGDPAPGRSALDRRAQ